MDHVTAKEIAAQFGLPEKQFRQALRNAALPWRPQYTRGINTVWTVPLNGPEHEDMLRVARQMSEKRADG